MFVSCWVLGFALGLLLLGLAGLLLGGVGFWVACGFVYLVIVIPSPNGLLFGFGFGLILFVRFGPCGGCAWVVWFGVGWVLFCDFALMWMVLIVLYISCLVFICD